MLTSRRPCNDHAGRAGESIARWYRPIRSAAAGLLRGKVENACLGSWGFTLREGFRECRRGAVGAFSALHDSGPALEKGGGLRLVVPVLADSLVKRDAGGRLAGGRS